MEIIQNQRKMITPVQCIFNTEGDACETKRYKVVAFCHEECVSDYKFDKGQALVLATNIVLVQENPEEYEILAETIMIVQIDDTKRTRDELQMQTRIAKSMVDGAVEMPAESWEDTPPSRSKRCRTIVAYPSDA